MLDVCGLYQTVKQIHRCVSYSNSHIRIVAVRSHYRERNGSICLPSVIPRTSSIPTTTVTVTVNSLLYVREALESFLVAFKRLSPTPYSMDHYNKSIESFSMYSLASGESQKSFLSIHSRTEESDLSVYQKTAQQSFISSQPAMQSLSL